MKSGNLNVLEPSGPLQACNGTAFTAEVTVHMFCVYLNRLVYSRDNKNLMKGWGSVSELSFIFFQFTYSFFCELVSHNPLYKTVFLFKQNLLCENWILTILQIA